MQKDVEAGRLSELDAIGGPIVRRGENYGVPTPATAELIALVEQRVAVSTGHRYADWSIAPELPRH